MAQNVTVNDILGVGFKYEQNAQEQITPAPTGTRAAFIGVAHWGAVGSPQFIDGGVTQFRSLFGEVDSIYDDVRAAADYHFKKSLLGYYTRVSDGTDTKAYHVAKLNDTIAYGRSGSAIATDLIALVAGTSDALTITFTDTSLSAPWSTGKAVNVTFTGAALATQGTAALTSSATAIAAGDSVGLAAGTYDLGIDIDGAGSSDIEITAVGTETWTQLATLIDTALTGAGAAISGAELLFTSDTYGDGSSIVITNGDGSATDGDLIAALSALAPYTMVIETPDDGVNSSSAAIVDQINSAVVADSDFISDYPDFTAPASILTSGADVNKLQVSTPFTGASVTIGFSGTADAVLSMAATAGTTGKSIGAFVAYHTGRDGNRIRYIYSEESATQNRLDIYFRGALVGTFINFNFDDTSPNYIGTLMADDDVVGSIVSYNHGVDEDGVALSPAITSADRLQDGDDTTLSGGTSGDSAIDVTTDLIPEITKYNEVKLYDVDIITAPSYNEESVQDELQAVCAKRQDCFAPIDHPLLTTVTQIKNWFNGTGSLGRSNKLNSEFLALYTPFVKIYKTIFNGPSGSEESETLPTLGDYSPLVRVIGAISESDAIAGTTTRAPAGIRTIMDDVEGIQLTFDENDHIQLYADAYDGIANQIVFTIDDGFYIEGQKTCLRKNEKGRLTSLSRINVMRTGLKFKKSVQRIVKFFFYAPVSPDTWDAFKSELKDILDVLVSEQAIEDNYIIQINADNNPPSVVNNNGMIANVEMTPLKALERIKVIANLTEAGAVVTITA